MIGHEGKVLTIADETYAAPRSVICKRSGSDDGQLVFVVSCMKNRGNMGVHAHGGMACGLPCMCLCCKSLSTFRMSR